MTYAYRTAASAALILSISFADASASTLPYRGYLTDDAGAPVEGRMDVSAELYACDGEETTCLSVWGPAVFEGVEVTGGLLAFGLSDEATDANEGEALESVLASNADLWLDVSLRADGEPVWTPLSPRHRLQAVPYAVVATDAQKLAGLDAASYAQFDDLSDYATKIELDEYALLEDLSSAGYVTEAALGDFGYVTSSTLDEMFTGYVTSSALQAALEGYATQADLLVQANALSQLTSTVEGNTALVNGLVANPYTDEAALAAVASSGYAKSAELPTIAALSGGNLSLIESVPNASTTESDAPQVNVAGTTSIELSLDSPRSYIELEAVYRVDATVAYMDYSSFPLPELRPDSVSVSGSAALEVWLATLENGGLVCNQGEPSDLLFTNKLEQVTGPLDTHGVVQTGINPKNPSDSWGLKTRGVERTVVALPPQDGPSTLCIKVVALAYCLGEQLGAECSVETTVEDIIVKSF